MIAGAYDLEKVPIDTVTIWAMDSDTVRQRFGLPLPFVRAAVGRAREPLGDGEVYLTSMSGDLRYAVMDRRTPYYVEPLDRWWAMFGTGFHKYMEEHAEKGTVENRIRIVVAGVTIRGRLDMLEAGILSDWKCTSAWTGKRLCQAEYNGNLLSEQKQYWDQLEITTAILHLNGNTVNTAELLMMYRDWSPAMFKYGSYPRKPFMMYDHPKLDVDACVKKLQRKVTAWKKGIVAHEAELPNCEFTFGLDKKTGLPVKCMKYCPLKDDCSAFARAKSAKKWKGE